MPKRAQRTQRATTADLRAEFWRAPDESLLDRKTTAAGMGYTVGWSPSPRTAAAPYSPKSAAVSAIGNSMSLPG